MIRENVLLRSLSLPINLSLHKIWFSWNILAHLEACSFTYISYTFFKAKYYISHMMRTPMFYLCNFKDLDVQHFIGRCTGWSWLTRHKLLIWINTGRFVRMFRFSFNAAYTYYIYINALYINIYIINNKLSF
jgi:hypothetical protein